MIFHVQAQIRCVFLSVMAIVGMHRAKKFPPLSTGKIPTVVCVLDVHDTMGYTEDPEAVHMSGAAIYWLSDDIKAVIRSAVYIVINIANEPFAIMQAMNIICKAPCKRCVTCAQVACIMH